jgi:CRP-like cAMP-binding protein
VFDTVAREPARLTEAERGALAPYAARAAWPAGFVVYQRGAPANGTFVVTRGRIVLRSQVRAARAFVPWIATPGETFGSEGLGPDAVYATDARADIESETLFLSAQRLRALVREQPHDALRVVAQLMGERASLLEKLRELTTMSVEQRVLTTLVRLATTETFALDNGRLVLAPQRYRLLCELVGATRESVSLALTRLSAAGLVERRGSTLIVGRPSELIRRLDDESAADAAFSRLAGTTSDVAEQPVQ